MIIYIKRCDETAATDVTRLIRLRKYVPAIHRGVVEESTHD